VCCRPLGSLFLPWGCNPTPSTGSSCALHIQHLLFCLLLAPCLLTFLCTAAARSAIGLSGAPAAVHALFVGCHVAVATAFYVYIARMSWPWALARVSLCPGANLKLRLLHLYLALLACLCLQCVNVRACKHVCVYICSHLSRVAEYRIIIYNRIFIPTVYTVGIREGASFITPYTQTVYTVCSVYIRRGRRWPIALYSAKMFLKYNMPKWCPADSLVSGAPRVTGWTESIL